LDFEFFTRRPLGSSACFIGVVATMRRMLSSRGRGVSLGLRWLEVCFVMTRAPKRQNLKAPGRCIFCKRGGLTKEHIFPDWLGKMVPRTATEKHARGALFNEDSPPLAIRNGKALTTKYRIVCKMCNETWMGGIENSTKPILLRMMRGDPTNLTFSDQVNLATWLTLKSMLVDLIDPRQSVIPQVVRTSMLERPTAPGRWHAWVAYSEMAFGQCGFISATLPGWLYNKGTLEKITPGDPDAPNSIAVAIFSGHFLGVAAFWPFGMPKDHFSQWNGEAVLQRIWPVNVLDLRVVAWPPRLGLTLGGMAHLPESILTGQPLPDRPWLLKI
jgi:hypothetical protein